MSRIASISLLVLLLGVACRDDEPRQSANPVAPVASFESALSLTIADSAVDTSSTVCRAYVREYAAVRAASDGGTTDVQLAQRLVALDAVIADACR